MVRTAIITASSNVPLPSAVPLPVIDTTRCTGCGRCVAACGPGVLSLETVARKKSAHLDHAQACTGCSLCARRCPFDVITMQRMND